MGIHKISIIVLNGLPDNLQKQVHKDVYWVRTQSMSRFLNAIYVRLYPPGDPRDWWICVRACDAGQGVGSVVHLGKPSVPVVTYTPKTGTELTTKKFFGILESCLLDKRESCLMPLDIVLSWAVSLMGDEEDVDKCIETIRTFNFFDTESACVVKPATSKEEFLEAAELSKYDGLCGHLIYKNMLKQVFKGDGVLLVAHPNRDDSDRPLPIIGYAAAKAALVRDKSFTITLVSMVVSPQFRRHGVATMLLDCLRTIYFASEVMTAVPMIADSSDIFSFLRAYGSKSTAGCKSTLADTSVLSSGNSDVVTFEIESLNCESAVGIIGI